MSYQAILAELKTKKYKPFYWLEGEEDYLIDQLTGYIEAEVLTPAEKEFNFTVFYGKDAAWADLINACRRYPMFSDWQVVILKEAQTMKDLDKLEPYFEKPLSSTILVVSYKWGKYDGRTRLAKLVKEKGSLLTTKRMDDRQLLVWIQEYLREKGYGISEKAVMLLIEHTGNELSRITNETDKLLLNLKRGTDINDQHIQDYIGISKEYNVFELQKALGNKDLVSVMKIIHYFQGNPKVAPLQMLLTLLYAYFNKVNQITHARAGSEYELSKEIGVPQYYFKDYAAASRIYGKGGSEKALLLLHEYNLKSIGIGSEGGNNPGLLKELVYKMMDC
jgi:DNA polymerase-3 subunit delta